MSIAIEDESGGAALNPVERTARFAGVRSLVSRQGSAGTVVLPLLKREDHSIAGPIAQRRVASAGAHAVGCARRSAESDARSDRRGERRRALCPCGGALDRARQPRQRPLPPRRPRSPQDHARRGSSAVPDRRPLHAGRLARPRPCGRCFGPVTWSCSGRWRRPSARGPCRRACGDRQSDCGRAMPGDRRSGDDRDARREAGGESRERRGGRDAHRERRRARRPGRIGGSCASRAIDRVIVAPTSAAGGECSRRSVPRRCSASA